MNWERTKRMTWWVLIIALLANVPAIAAMQGESEQQQTGEPTMEMGRQMKMMQRGEMVPLHNGNEMLGVQIQDTAGQDVGMIENLALDLQKNKVCAVILSVGDRLYPVPRYAFTEKADGRTCILNMKKNQFMDAPNYEAITDENLNDADWRQHINDYYSSRISKEAMMKAMGGMGHRRMHGEMEHPAEAEMAAPMAQPGRFAMLTDIVGLDVMGVNKNDLGQLENVLICAKTGYLVYGLVSYGGMMGVGEKTAAVPWVALNIQPDLEYATLNADMAQLEKATIREADIQKLEQPAYAQRFYQAFGEEPYYWEVFGFMPGMEAKSMRAWMRESMYNMKFDPAKMETIEGKIKSVGVFRPERGSTSGLRLKVETADGKMMTVYAGPKYYAAMQDMKFKAGRDITVTGSAVTVGKRSVIMASQVTSEGKTLKLRDEQGKPMWNVEALKEKMQQHKSMPEKSEESKRMY